VKNLYIVLILLTLLIVGCGESDVENEVIIDKFTDNQATYTIDYFYKIGFKVNKEYDVSGLENANGAWFGFWKNSTGKSIDYEVRFYPDHQSALDYGLKYVDEVIGDDAILKKSASSWTEGIQDRRTRSGNGYGGSSDSVKAKYLHYLVYDNAIILCSGLDLSYAIQNCTELILALKEL